MNNLIIISIILRTISIIIEIVKLIKNWSK